MKNIKFIYTKITVLLACAVMMMVSCERELSDQAVFATFPTTPEIFNDNPVGLGTDFYLPFLGSKPTAWTVDQEVSFEGSASMRFDVPNVGDPEGQYAGAIFRTDGEGSGRDLSGYDALTFWAKGSEARTINEVGFGQDFLGNKFQVKLQSPLRLTTNWVKYIIPIPDPSKLIEERGMFWYSEGPDDDGSGWTFWVDDLRFENLGTVAQPRPEFVNGADITESTFIGTTINLAERGLTQTLNLANGRNQTVVAAPSYFDFTSSDPSVAEISDLGMVTILKQGNATITAEIAGVEAKGSITFESSGGFDEAPIPTRNANNVISIFSDTYTDVPVDYYNGFFLDGFQTTLGGAPPLTLGSGQVINYTMLNFVGIGTFFDVPTLNLTDMTHIHIDINVQEAIDSGDYIELELLNSVGNNEISGASRIESSQLRFDEWVSIDIPLADFGLASRNAIGLLFVKSDNTISNIYVDNIYYYKE